MATDTETDTNTNTNTDTTTATDRPRPMVTDWVYRLDSYAKDLRYAIKLVNSLLWHLLKTMILIVLLILGYAVASGATMGFLGFASDALPI